MRNFITTYIDSINNSYFLHCDVFNTEKFNNTKCLNLGLRESSICNIAAGIAKDKKNKVFIYSLANYVLNKGFESIYYNLNDWSNGGMIFLAGSGFAYYNAISNSHTLFNDIQLIQGLKNYKIYSPARIYELKNVIDEYVNNETNTIYFVKLGLDKFNEYIYKKEKIQFPFSYNKPNILSTGWMTNYYEKNINQFNDFNILHFNDFNDILNFEHMTYMTYFIYDQYSIRGDFEFKGIDKSLNIPNFNNWEECVNFFNFDINSILNYVKC